MSKPRFAIVLTASLLAACAVRSERDAVQAAAEHARALVGQMTLEEKVSQLRYDAPAIPRLGIPAYNWWSEALHGVARAGPATVFPQAIGLAATFDDSLMHAVASAISDEARAKYTAFVRAGQRDIYEGLTFFSPNINIFRDPRWGRGQETFGEDPYLSGRMGVAFVRGMQGEDPRYLKTLATSKHFAVHSGPEPLRHTADENPSAQDLWDTYLPAFEATVREGHVGSVMCAYSAFRGSPDCASPTLLDSILRGRMGFQGYVVSDCWAIADFFQTHKVVKTEVEAAALGLARGTDLNCGVAFRLLATAVQQGLVAEAAVDTAVVRLLTARFRLGVLGEVSVPWDTIPYAVVGSAAHRALALRAAHESIVLLKNDGVLPLDSGVRTVAVIGPNARNYEVIVGNYHGTPRAVSYIPDAIRQRLGVGGRVIVTQGSELAEGVPTLVPIPAAQLSAPEAVGGLRAEYYTNATAAGAPVTVRVDSGVDFTWLDHPPVGEGVVDSFAVRWSGAITAPAAGTYRIGLVAMNRARFFFRDSLMFSFSTRHEPETRSFTVRLQAGRSYPVRIEFDNWGPNPEAHLVWSPPHGDLQTEAVAAAGQADAVVLVLGLSPTLEGEESGLEIPGFAGGDRTTLGLPAPQQALMQAVAAVGKPTVLVLTTGSAVALPWAEEHVPAIVEAWYPGEVGGLAVADVLFGDYNPAGRLPVTFYRSVNDLPPFTDYAMRGRTYRYFEGMPLYPFGFGLSYTTFRYTSLRLPASIRANAGATVSVDVTNAGSRAGDEVVQVYLAHRGAPFGVPLRTLKAFRRIHLAAGETRTVPFTLSRDALAVVDPMGQKVVLAGTVEIAIGGGQPGARGQAGTVGTARITP